MARCRRQHEELACCKGRRGTQEARGREDAAGRPSPPAASDRAVHAPGVLKRGHSSASDPHDFCRPGRGQSRRHQRRDATGSPVRITTSPGPCPGPAPAAAAAFSRIAQRAQAHQPGPAGDVWGPTADSPEWAAASSSSSSSAIRADTAIPTAATIILHVLVRRRKHVSPFESESTRPCWCTYFRSPPSPSVAASQTDHKRTPHPTASISSLERAAAASADPVCTPRTAAVLAVDLFSPLGASHFATGKVVGREPAGHAVR